MTPDQPAGDERLFLGGFGPLAVALVLAVLAVLLVPSVAPEEVVTAPVTTTSTSTTVVEESTP
jgi:hypothetical protein